MAAGINFSTTYYMSRSCSQTFRLMLASVFSRCCDRVRRIIRPTRPCPVYQFSGSDERDGGGEPQPGRPGCGERSSSAYTQSGPDDEQQKEHEAGQGQHDNGVVTADINRNINREQQKNHQTQKKNPKKQM